MKTLLFSVEDRIATIILNRPEALNALNLDMRYEILDVLNEVESNPEIRVVVITGAGRAFCSGGDVKDMKNRWSSGSEDSKINPFLGRGRVKSLGEVILKITNLEKPVIAAVNGIAAGAGANLALAADIIIASEEAKFSQAFVKLGLVPDGGGIYTLSRLVGVAKAKELIFTARMVEAVEAEKIGLVNTVVPVDKFQDKVKEIAVQLAAAPPQSLGIAKAILNKVDQMDLATELEYEALAQSVCSLSQDHQEGVSAFFEKRIPNFQGK